MKYYESKFLLGAALIEFVLSCFLALILFIINFMLIDLFPEYKSNIFYTLAGAMLLIYYCFARSSIYRAIKTARLFKNGIAMLVEIFSFKHIKKIFSFKHKKEEEK